MQQRVYSILDGLNIAVIEMDPVKNNISFSNEAAFKLLQSSYRQMHPQSPLPDLLTKNKFLLAQAGQGLSEQDLALQNELVSYPMFKLHKTKINGKIASLQLDQPKPDFSLS